MKKVNVSHFLRDSFIFGSSKFFLILYNFSIIYLKKEYKLILKISVEI